MASWPEPRWWRVVRVGHGRWRVAANQGCWAGDDDDTGGWRRWRGAGGWGGADGAVHGGPPGAVRGAVSPDRPGHGSGHDFAGAGRADADPRGVRLDGRRRRGAS